MPTLLLPPPISDAPACRRLAIAGSLLLHAALLGLLLFKLPVPSPATAASSPRLSVVTLGAPSPAPRRAAAPLSHAQASRPPVHKARPGPATKAAVRPELGPPAVNTSDAASAPASATTTTEMAGGGADASTLAAAAPDAVEPEVPPPLEYLRRISKIISLSQKYPWHARQYGHQGDVIVRMHLARDGTVMTATLLSSSGHASLDAEARDVVLRIRRFPPFPADYIPQQHEFDIDQPVSFRTYLN